MRARLTALVVALGLCAVPTAVVVAGANAGGPVFVRTALDSDHLAVRPETIALSVHGSLWLHKVHYESYGGAVAKATARARVHACVPDCNIGKIGWPPARVRLSKVVRCRGRLVYGRLGYALRGALPEGVERRGRIDMVPRDC